MKRAALLSLLCLLPGCAGIWPNTGGPSLQRPELETKHERPTAKIVARASEEELRLRIQELVGRGLDLRASVWA